MPVSVCEKKNYFQGGEVTSEEKNYLLGNSFGLDESCKYVVALNKSICKKRIKEDFGYAKVFLENFCCGHVPVFRVDVSRAIMLFLKRNLEKTLIFYNKAKLPILGEKALLFRKTDIIAVDFCGLTVVANIIMNFYDVVLKKRKERRKKRKWILKKVEHETREEMALLKKTWLFKKFSHGIKVYYVDGKFGIIFWTKKYISFLLRSEKFSDACNERDYIMEGFKTASVDCSAVVSARNKNEGIFFRIEKFYLKSKSLPKAEDAIAEFLGNISKIELLLKEYII